MNIAPHLLIREFYSAHTSNLEPADESRMLEETKIQNFKAIQKGRKAKMFTV